MKALAGHAPKTALTLRNGKEAEVPVDARKLDDIVIVRPGVRIPVDGVIQEGQSEVDQSPVTGEATPVDKDPGDQVFAGSVTKLSKDSTLSRVMQMVEEAQTQKPPSQQTTEKFTSWSVSVVLIGDFLLIVIAPLFGVPLSVSFLRAMTLLVAASPCALALGTPAAIPAGIAQAARNGVLIKGGAHLENLGRLKAIALDKTGTVTKGKSELTDIVRITCK